MYWCPLGSVWRSTDHKELFATSYLMLGHFERLWMASLSWHKSLRLLLFKTVQQNSQKWRIGSLTMPTLYNSFYITRVSDQFIYVLFGMIFITIRLRALHDEVLSLWELLIWFDMEVDNPLWLVKSFMILARISLFNFTFCASLR